MKIIGNEILAASKSLYYIKLSKIYFSVKERFLKFHMSDSTQHSLMAKEIQEIVNLCKQSPSKLEVGIVNLHSLYKAMKGFELAPKAYISLFDSNNNKSSTKSQAIESSKKAKTKINSEKYPVLLKLGQIYGRVLKSTEMKDLAIIISKKSGLYLNRDQKRNKAQLLDWFSDNWDIIEPIIRQNSLENINFGQT